MRATLVLAFAVALLATVLGSPSAEFLDKKGPAESATYTAQLLNNGKFIGAAGLISDKYAICVGHLVEGALAESLSLRVGTTSTSTILPVHNGKVIKVISVLVHPDAKQGADVAVLELAEAITATKSASSLPVVGPAGTPSGSHATVSAWSKSLFTISLAVSQEWAVLPQYCNASSSSSSSLCATGTLQEGALLRVGDSLVGLALAKGKGSIANLAAYVDLADASVQKFIAVATAQPIPTGKPTDAPPAVTTREPATTTRKPAPTRQPATTRGPKPTTKKPIPTGKTCKIHVNGGLPTGEPILVQENELTFRDPDTSDAVVIAAGERIRMACTGKDNAFQLDRSKSILTVECIDDDKYLVNGKTVGLEQLGCKSLAANSAQKVGTCGANNEFVSIHIGFEMGKDFVTQIENCFDSRTFDAVYSRSNMTPAVAGHESGVKRPSFTPAGFYENINPNNLYTRKVQRATVSKLLNSDELGNKYISGDSLHFLARGHLSAKADYILGAQQRATFYYINAAPQWQTFNGDNWEKLESSLRDWVISSGRSVQVVTGTWGVATLPNVDGKETELYLEGDKKYMRVPKYYWKVVYDPATKEAAAFVGMNNPYHVTVDSDILCKDVCDKYTWLGWNTKLQTSGTGFCCDVNELRKVITTIPADLDVQTLL